MPDFDEESMRAWLQATLEGLAPRISVAALTELEREHGESVDLLLGTLSSLVDSFESALSLFDYVQHHAPSQFQWQIIAASDAVMTVWNFGKALDALNAAYKSSPTLLKELGGKRALKPAIGKFGAYFSNPSTGSIVEARNANSHFIEQLATAGVRRVNSLPSGILISRGLRVVDGIATIEYSRQRHLHKLEFSRASLAKLQEIKNFVFDLFRPASAVLAVKNSPRSQ
jgi:hypothetical protein